MLYSKNSLFVPFKNGLVLLPHIHSYDERLADDTAIELNEDDILECVVSSKKLFYKYLKKINNKPVITTLSKNKFNSMKEEFWEVFNTYQTNNPSRYRIEKGSRVTLTFEDFTKVMNDFYKKIDNDSLNVCFRTHMKYISLRQKLESIGIDYKEFFKKRMENYVQLDFPVSVDDR